MGTSTFINRFDKKHCFKAMDDSISCLTGRSQSCIADVPERQGKRVCVVKRSSQRDTVSAPEHECYGTV